MPKQPMGPPAMAPMRTTPTLPQIIPMSSAPYQECAWMPYGGPMMQWYPPPPPHPMESMPPSVFGPQFPRQPVPMAYPSAPPGSCPWAPHVYDPRGPYEPRLPPYPHTVIPAPTPPPIRPPEIQPPRTTSRTTSRTHRTSIPAAVPHNERFTYERTSPRSRERLTYQTMPPVAIPPPPQRPTPNRSPTAHPRGAYDRFNLTTPINQPSIEASHRP